MKHGYLAVDLFFVLSGFVMAMSYSHMFADGFGVGHYLTFLIRRLARVYPLYIAVTFLVVLLSLSGVSRDLSIHHFGFRLAANILLVQGWGLSESINGPAWSISVEFAAYLLFPLLLGIAGRASPLAIFGLCMAAVAWLSFLPDPQPGQPRWGPLDIPWAESPWPLVRCLAEFMLGLMTYRVMSEDLVRRLIGKSLVQVSIILAIVCLLFFHPTDVVIVALLPALILVLAKGDGASATFFGSPFVFFLGEISYSVYLLHWQYLRILRWTYSYLIQRAGAPLASIGSLLLFAIALLVSSWLAFLFLERPARRWMRKLEGLVGQTREPRFL